jgi:hypothetical protein
MGASGGDYGSVGYGYKYGTTSGSHTYAVGDYASQLRFDNGGFSFLTAPLGTAGASVGFSKVMTIIPGGNVGIGTTAPSSILHLNAASRTQALRIYTSGNTSNYLSLGQGSGGAVIDPIGTGVLYLGYDQVTNVILGYGGGNVGIGTNSPDAKLAVGGQVHAQEVKVSITVPGPDYVFEKDYPLASLEDIETYIDQNKHLPDVPSAKEMEKNGVQLGEMNMLLLKKIEELTLYVIELKKENEEQNKQIKELKKPN